MSALKDGVRLDLMAPVGGRRFNDLGARKVMLERAADRVIDMAKGSGTQRLAIHPTTLSVLNPRIVTCSIKDFGNTEPNIDRAACGSHHRP